MRIIKRNRFPEFSTCLSGPNVFWVAFGVITSGTTAPEALLSFHATFFGNTLDPFFTFPVFPNFVLIVVIRSAWVVRLSRIPYDQLLYIFILNEISCVNSCEILIIRTFLFFLPPPLRFGFPRKPLISSSNTMEGGLTFFPHPDLWLDPEPGPTGFDSGRAGTYTSTRVGGAATTAVAEIDVGGALVTPT